MISLLRKLSRSLSMGLSGVGLGFFGYASGVLEQSPEAIQGIRIMFCVVPAIACTISAFLLLGFPISRKRHEEIQRTLRERYAADGRQG
jgi:GPH family glycoside/pentoside/hexuronide:cation symporter